MDNGTNFLQIKIAFTLGTLVTRYESLGFMREGKVDFSKESHSLKISWTVKLDSLYFLVYVVLLLQE